jgi:hypothetical protein
LTQPVTQKHRRGDASYTARIAPYKWKPGYCPNPGGKPKHDVAKEIAKAIFENNQELVYKAFVKALAKGNAYCYQTLADRAYGKLKERVEVEAGPYREMSEAELRERIAKLERELGVLPAHLEPDQDPKPN